MRHITTQHLVDILNELDAVFDAHAAEKKALGLFAQVVGQELAEYQNSARMSALQKFSMNFAQTIDQIFGSESNRPQIRKTNSGPKGDGKVESENLAGKISFNQQWEKRSKKITMP